MKNIFILFIYLLFCISSYSQTRTEKYNSLYERYEYFDQNGQMVGYKKYNSLLGQWEYYETKTNSTKKYGEYIQPIDIGLLERTLAAKQARYDQQIAELKRQQKETAEIERQKAVIRMNQIIDYYNNANSYPTTIKDGWHSVYSMNNYDFCDQRKVFVENNKITRYIVDNWSPRTVTYSMPIQHGKTSIRLQETESELINIFFLEATSDPNSYSTPPIKPGKVSFWTNSKKGYIDIYVEGSFIGTLQSHFTEGTPNCGQSGTVVFENKPGTYSYVAKSSQGTWSGTITISGTGCSNMKLNK